MAYGELIKDFSHIRNYMRDFYVYGFKSRSDYDSKSARSYDNERRRMDSWLGDYMRFRQDSNGKCVFMSVDSRTIEHNPLHEAFRAKSFTDNDIVFHFCVMDLLSNGDELTSSEVLEAIEDRYLYIAPDYPLLDESTIRKKLREYVDDGLLKSKKKGVKTVYSRQDDRFDKNSWSDCVAFFSESSPLGVIGSFIQPMDCATPFRFKHHYILTALDTEILFRLVSAIKDKRRVEIDMWSRKNGKVLKHDVCPACFYISTQNGRQYVLVTQSDCDHPLFYRLDLIRDVRIRDKEPAFDELRDICIESGKHIWGVSRGENAELEHFSMKLHVEPNEGYIVQRLIREKRTGDVAQIDNTTWQFSIDVYDSMELLPWIRMFTGRITELKCSNDAVSKAYYDDLKQMAELYGGDSDAVQ